MFESLYASPLAEVQSWRTILLLRNSHIELNWDWYTFYLRMADLLVLSQALEEWFEAAEEPAEVYTVWLGSERLTLSTEDLADFHELVTTAAAGLPRRVVRWVDHQMRIEPHLSNLYNGHSYYSLN